MWRPLAWAANWLFGFEDMTMCATLGCPSLGHHWAITCERSFFRVPRYLLLHEQQHNCARYFSMATGDGGTDFATYKRLKMWRKLWSRGCEQLQSVSENRSCTWMRAKGRECEELLIFTEYSLVFVKYSTWMLWNVLVVLTFCYSWIQNDWQVTKNHILMLWPLFSKPFSHFNKTALINFFP